MSLKPPSGGLRPIGNHSKSPIRTEVVIPVGDALEVSEFVAEQLTTAGLKDGVPAALPVEEDTAEPGAETVAPKPRRSRKATA